MKWLNLSLSDLGSDNFISASLEQRGAWLGLLRYCILHENGGEIVKCQHWTDLQWMQACGVTEAMVKAPSTLWNWNGDCLRVVAYPIQQEESFKKMQAGGRKGAAKKYAKVDPSKLRVYRIPE